MKKEKPIKVTMKAKGLQMDCDRQEFALILHTWRLRRGLTQQQVGDMWKVSRYTIMRAERGKPITWQMAYRLFARLSEEIRKEGDEVHHNH